MPAESLPLWKYVVAGGSAGAIEICIMYPTDVIKTRSQISTNSSDFRFHVKDVLKSQGVKGFYRGILSPILAEAPKRAWKFSANEKFKQLLKKSGEDVISPVRAALAGSLSGMSEALINCPFETVKVRMQSPAFVSKFNSTFQCALYLIKTEGFTSLYKGLEAQVWRNGVWNAAYFGFLGWHKRYYASSETEVNLYQKFYVGVIGSTVGTLLNTPFDVVKSRMQNQSDLTESKDAENKSKSSLKYRNSFQALRVVIQEEGVGAVYKGLGARLVRLGPGGGIMIVAFEGISELLRDF